MGFQSHLRSLIPGLVALSVLTSCGSDENAGSNNASQLDCASIEDWQDRLDCAYNQVAENFEDDDDIFKIDEADNIHVVLFLSSKKDGEIGSINSTLK